MLINIFVNQFKLNIQKEFGCLFTAPVSICEDNTASLDYSKNSTTYQSTKHIICTLSFHPCSYSGKYYSMDFNPFCGQCSWTNVSFNTFVQNLCACALRRACMRMLRRSLWEYVCFLFICLLIQHASAFPLVVWTHLYHTYISITRYAICTGIL